MHARDTLSFIAAGLVKEKTEGAVDVLDAAGKALLDYSDMMDCMYPNGWTKHAKTAASAAGVVYDVWSATKNPKGGVKATKRFTELVKDAGSDVAMTILDHTVLAEHVDCDALMEGNYAYVDAPVEARDFGGYGGATDMHVSGGNAGGYGAPAEDLAGMPASRGDDARVAGNPAAAFVSWGYGDDADNVVDNRAGAYADGTAESPAATPAGSPADGPAFSGDEFATEPVPIHVWPHSGVPIGNSAL